MRTLNHIARGISLLDMLKKTKPYFESESNTVLDIAGYKPPILAQKLAGWYPDSRITHFREDTIRIGKISPKIARTKNLTVVGSYEELNDHYNIALAFFTIHELRNPKKSLKKILKKLDEHGKFIAIDYDLSWFADEAKRQGWNTQTQKEYFSREIFTEENECRVLGMRRGKIIPARNRNEDIIEAHCVEHHTRLGRKDYAKLFAGLGLKELELISYEIKTPWGEKPKQFLYIGEN